MHPIVTAVLMTSLALVAGCGSPEVDRADPLPTTPVRYADNGVAIKKPDDVRKLTDAPEDFRQFIAGRLDEARSTRDPEFPECVPTIGVDVYDPTGFASGSRTDCGGYAIIWAKKGGVWQEVWGGQDLADCSDLKSKGVPASVAFDQKCFDKKMQKARAYRG